MEADTYYYKQWQVPRSSFYWKVTMYALKLILRSVIHISGIQINAQMGWKIIFIRRDVQTMLER